MASVRTPNDDDQDTKLSDSAVQLHLAVREYIQAHHRPDAVQNLTQVIKNTIPEAFLELHNNQTILTQALGMIYDASNPVPNRSTNAV